MRTTTIVIRKQRPQDQNKLSPKDKAKNSAQKQTARVIANPALLKKGIFCATTVSEKAAARPQQHPKPQIQSAAKQNLVYPDYFKISKLKARTDRLENAINLLSNRLR
ncbi:hypothetical protein M0802_012588 [Mischocyttarus mexicanus]|nr:hypothetical protein M0802_012588 [Mischocyttarus mexicanus]